MEKESINLNETAASTDGLGHRIAQVAVLVGGKKVLAKFTSISESQLYRYISGQSQPTAQPLAAIAHAGKVDLDWLITGRGRFEPRLIDGEISATGRRLTRNEFIEIPYYNLEGFSENNQAEKSPTMGKFAFRTDWLLHKNLDLDSLRLIHAYGDSMETTISDGDLLLIDISQTNVVGDAIFILRMDQHLVTKRLQHAIDGGIYISSDNAHYREQYVSPDKIGDVQIVGRIVWIAGSI